MFTRRLTALLLLLGLSLPAIDVAAFGRDTDGSRMQARPISAGSSDDDRLSPPNDSIDWRYFRLSDASDITVTVTGAPKGVSLDIVLTDAMGKTITRGSTGKSGTFRTQRRFDPGLYYVSVSASSTVSYKITVR